jgi:hypothetical protein
MEQKAMERIGIVASIIGAVGAIVYILRKPTVAVGPIGPAGAPGAAYGIPGVTGPVGAVETPGAGLEPAAAAPAGAGVPGAPAATVQGVTPTGQSLNEYFVSQFYQPSGGPYSTGAINSNVPPSLDLMKQFGIDAAGGGGTGNGAGKAGCGCSGGRGGSGGRGCGGGRCPNQPGALMFHDGSGSCASTTTGRLQGSMDKCEPGNLGAFMGNLPGNVGWWPGIPGPIPDQKFMSIVAVGPSKFGMS